jgi:hypothetical protein
MSGDSEVSDILTNDFQEKKEGYEPGTGSAPPGLTMEINCFISSECSVPSDAKIANAEERAEEIGQQPIPVPANGMCQFVTQVASQPFHRPQPLSFGPET